MTGESGPPIAQLLAYALLIAMLAGAGLGLRRRRRASGAAADGPAGEPYRVYTRDFDQELHARDLLERLPAISLDREKGWQTGDPRVWKRSIARVRELADAQREAIRAWLPRWRRAAQRVERADLAFALLIDQSGSMKGESIVAAAAAAELVAALLGELGARVEILGFTTAGWHGGKARARWVRQGQPARPGRLCALLHVVYKSADEPVLAESARDMIVHPDLLRENVDGEAILWARRRLAALPERRKLLLILSDGAPVDDSTWLANGPNYLGRHFETVLADVHADPDLVVGAVGIAYRIDRFFPLSECAYAPIDVAPAAARVVERMLAAAKEKAGFPLPRE